MGGVSVSKGDALGAFPQATFPLRTEVMTPVVVLTFPNVLKLIFGSTDPGLLLCDDGTEDSTPLSCWDDEFSGFESWNKGFFLIIFPQHWGVWVKLNPRTPGNHEAGINYIRGRERLRTTAVDGKIISENIELNSCKTSRSWPIPQ